MAELVYLLDQVVTHTSEYPDFLLEVFMKSQMMIVQAIEKTQEMMPLLSDEQTVCCINSFSLFCLVLSKYSV